MSTAGSTATSAARQLIQGGEGIIAGYIHAEDARLAGTVEGTVSARTLIVEASARILGDVAYETISIEAGAQIEGRLARRASLGLDEPPRDRRAGLLLAGAARRRTAEAGERLFPIPDSAETAAE